MPWLAHRKHIPSHGLSFLFSHWKQRASLGVAGRTMAGEPLGVEGGGPSGSLEEGLKVRENASADSSCFQEGYRLKGGGQV